MVIVRRLELRLRLRRLRLHGGVEKDIPFRRIIFRSCFRLFVAVLVLVVVWLPGSWGALSAESDVVSGTALDSATEAARVAASGRA